MPIQDDLQLLTTPDQESGKLHAPVSAAALRSSVPRILVAEDNPINQRVASAILQRAGYRIDIVDDGFKAIESFKENGYDLILMDCQMPTMDGLEASRRIRQIEGDQPVIVAVTANAMVGERERCLNAGMNDYLSKPFGAEQLVAVVKKWCQPPSTPKAPQS